jgi:hypothetical protein
MAGLVLVGCGSSSDFDQISGQQQSGDTPVNGQLTGVWGAYFPDRQVDQDQGVEIQFGRREREGFIVRDDGVAPQNMEFSRSGDSLRIVLTDRHNFNDQSLISGTLVDPTTMRGRFVNQSRGEDHPIELKRHPDSDQFLIGVDPLVTAQDVGTTEPIEILQITATGENGRAYRFDVWPGYPGYFRMRSPTLSKGYCYIQPLYWFASFSNFELTEYDDPDIPTFYLGSLYLKIDDWAKVGYAPLTLVDSGDGSYIEESNRFGANFPPTAVDIKDFTIQVLPSTETDFGSDYNLYKERYDPSSVFLYYSDRFPSVTRLVGYYLNQYRY